MMKVEIHSDVDAVTPRTLREALQRKVGARARSVDQRRTSVPQMAGSSRPRRQ